MNDNRKRQTRFDAFWMTIDLYGSFETQYAYLRGYLMATAETLHGTHDFVTDPRFCAWCKLHANEVNAMFNEWNARILPPQ